MLREWVCLAAVCIIGVKSSVVHRDSDQEMCTLPPEHTDASTLVKHAGGHSMRNLMNQTVTSVKNKFGNERKDNKHPYTFTDARLKTNKKTPTIPLPHPPTKNPPTTAHSSSPVSFNPCPPFPCQKTRRANATKMIHFHHTYRTSLKSFPLHNQLQTFWLLQATLQ